ncbi:uncharacterized protein LOC135308662 isoform X2 [Passer domesticus]|uniref:uncharacterized protein LOC135308662 isoform X2 n=1 Tax=Passer domesticus TaxID=48849 RepID=UPI0030FE845A
MCFWHSVTQLPSVAVTIRTFLLKSVSESAVLKIAHPWQRFWKLRRSAYHHGNKPDLAGEPCMDCSGDRDRQPQPQAGEAPWPRCLAWGAGSCAPAQRRTRGRQPAPRTPLPALGRAGRLGPCRARAAPGRGAEPAPGLPSQRSPQLFQDQRPAAEHLRCALPRLQSPQRPLRETAVSITGAAGALMTGQKEELQVLAEALQAIGEDQSPSCRSTLMQLAFKRRSAGFVLLLDPKN